MIALSYVTTTEEETTYFRLLKVLKSFEASMASKQPRRSILKSDLKFMAQTTYTTMFVWTVLTSFWHFDRKKKERTNLPLLDLSASPQVKIRDRQS